MPLVTIPTAGGDSVRIRCELHTPWTQLIGHPELQNTSTSPSNASANQHPGASSGAAAASPVPAMPLRTTPISGAAGSAPATAEGVPQAGGSSADSQLRQRREPQHSPPRDQPHLQFHGDTMVNDPQRSKLLIVASLGVEGGSGWFSHVAQHFADLRDPATGQPAADVVTFDNRRRWSARAGSPPPKQGASGYSSEAMAADALALLDALGWQRAHLVGMSLGAMVAAKAAAAAPQRTASLTLLGYTLNGWQMAASLVTRPDRLLPVIVGSERSRVRATLPFYFTRRFLDAPLPPQWQQGAVAAAAAAAASSTLQAASRRWLGGEGSSRGRADVESGTGQHSSGSTSPCGSEPGGGDVPVTGRLGSPSRQLKQALLGRQHRPAPDEKPPVLTREDAILANQALASEAARSSGAASAGTAAAAPHTPQQRRQDGGPTAGAAAAAQPPAMPGAGSGTRGDNGRQARTAWQSKVSPQAAGFAQAADAALGEAGPDGPAAAGAAAAAEPDETSLPDTGLRSHSLACLLHWLTRPERRTIADAEFPTTLLVGRHDPVSPVKWVQHAAAKLRATLVVTEASHAGLTVESCPEVLSSLELNVFGRTLGDSGGWRAVQDAAIGDCVTNPHLIKR